MNLYAYVGGDPVNWIDPWGLAGVLPVTPPVAGTTPGKLTPISTPDFNGWFEKQCIRGKVVLIFYNAFMEFVHKSESDEKCDGECPSPENVPDFDFNDPTKAPVGPDGVPWEWKGQPPQGGPKGGYKNPNGPESLHPDLDHDEPVGPHWDFNDRKGPGWRIKPGGIAEPK